jgi:UDP-glucose 4-epimerase
MRTLVTGGAGFIGSSLVDALLEREDEVVVLDDLSTGSPENVSSQAKLIEGDVVDIDLLRSLASGCDVIFHQAAHRAVLRSVEHPLETNRANVEGTLAVLCAARDCGVRRVVAASSSSIYGPGAPLPTPETAATTPASPYAVSKLAGEHYCRVFSDLYGVETVSLRYFNVYGPRQRPDSQYAAVIPLFIDALTQGEPPLIFGDGLQSRDFTYIDDVVAANLCAVESPSERCDGRAFNIAGGAAFSLLDLLGLLEELLETEAVPTFEDPRPGDVRHTRADTSEARRALGYAPAVGFREGLAQTISWFRSARCAP